MVPSPTESFARLFPKFIILALLPPLCPFIMVKNTISTTTDTSIGRILVRNQFSSCTFSTLGSMLKEIRNCSISLTSVTYKVFSRPLSNVTVTSPVGVCRLGVISALTTRPASRSFINSPLVYSIRLLSIKLGTTNSASKTSITTKYTLNPLLLFTLFSFQKLLVTIQSHANYDNMDVECMHS